jgi:Zn-dependent protease with chaperone function
LAALLTLFAALCLGPMSVRLDQARWPTRAPRAAVVLWQALRVGGAVAMIAAGLAVAVARFRAGLVTGVDKLVHTVTSGHPLAGLDVPEALGLTLAADVAIVLLAVALVMMVRTARIRAHHRRLLDLVSVEWPRPHGTHLLDHPRATAYCLPGLRPRIVLSRGAVQLLESNELAAVVEHERGHAHEHHGLVMTSLSSFTQPLRWIPYARRAPVAVASLLEMPADDFAARHHDPEVLASALVRLGSDAYKPRFSFCATSTAVSERVMRLLDGQRSSKGAALGAGCLALVAVAAPLLAVFA